VARRPGADRAAEAAVLKLKLSSSQANDPKFANGRSITTISSANRRQQQPGRTD